MQRELSMISVRIKLKVCLACNFNYLFEN